MKLKLDRIISIRKEKRANARPIIKIRNALDN